MAHVCDLGYLLDRKNVATTLSSIMKYNWRDNFFEHFNHFRSYALGDDQGLLVATYPKGRRPERPFPYCNEVWTGLEYTAAAGMLFEGQNADGLKVIAAARARHDGRRRNPFDEPECGHHYARAMAAWATLLAWTGFHYDGVDQHISFKRAEKPATWFWSTGDAWGICAQSGNNLKVDVLGGEIAVAKVSLSDGEPTALPSPRRLKTGDSFDCTV
jgi:non-lysosomal glucosylceramidase